MKIKTLIFLSIASLHALPDIENKSLFHVQHNTQHSMYISATNNLKADCASIMKEVKAGNRSKVAEFLAKGISVNIQTDEGVTPLICSISNGQHEITELLIHTGANLNLADNKGITALMTATRAGDEESAKLLLEHGADPEQRSDDGCTALGIARKNGYTALAALIQSYIKPSKTTIPEIK